MRTSRNFGNAWLEAGSPLNTSNLLEVGGRYFTSDLISNGEVVTSGAYTLLTALTQPARIISISHIALPVRAWISRAKASS
jgi:hypothetical protein